MNIQPETIQQLIERFNRGTISSEEEQLLEQCIEQGLVELEQLDDLSRLGKHLEAMGHLQLTNAVHKNFQEMLATAKAKTPSEPKRILSGIFQKSWHLSPVLQAAIVVIALLAGFGGGYWWKFRAPNQHQEIAQMRDELKSVKEMMMLTLLEKESIHDRLKAVQISEELNGASEKVTQALLRTLDNDPNINVRLAALEALVQYANHPEVREGLIRSIQHQNSPMVQAELAEVMVSLQEKRSVEAFEKLLKEKQTPEEVKEKIKSSIQILM